MTYITYDIHSSNLEIILEILNKFRNFEITYKIILPKLFYAGFYELGSYTENSVL